MTSNTNFRNRYNRVATKSHPYTPYCYLLRHKRTGLVYYGSKSSSDSHPAFFMVFYFTSSKIVKAYLQSDGIDAFEWEIRKTFTNRDECIKWESKVLRRMKVHENDKFINIDANQKAHNNRNTTFITNETSGACVRVKIGTEIPSGWVPGNDRMRGDLRVRERRWFHNPETGESFHIKPTEVFGDLIPGRGNKYTGNGDALKAKNLIWITDGTNSIQINKESEIPTGWVRGRTKSESEREASIDANKKLRGFSYINDGVTYKLVHEITVLEQGFIYGKTRTGEYRYPYDKSKIYITNGITNCIIDAEYRSKLPSGYRCGLTQFTNKLKGHVVTITDGIAKINHPTMLQIPEGWFIFS